MRSARHDPLAALPRLDLPLESRTVASAWQRAVMRRADQLFVTSDAGSVSYGALDQQIDRVAEGLRRQGLERYGKIALMLKNSVAFIELWLAAAKMGAVYVPINIDYKGDVLAHQLNRAEVTHLVIEAEFLDRVTALRARLPRLACIIVANGGGDVDSLTYDELRQAPAVTPQARPLYTDPHAISFTSGTTGLSKGVLASNCHIVTFALDWIEACRFTPQDRLYSCLPMFHAIATWLGLLPTILQQTSCAFAERFSASRFWDDVRRYQATAIHGIFAMVPILLKQPPRPDDATGPARVFYIGQRNAAFEQRFGCRIVEVYGATETGIVTYTPYDEPGVAGSCGRANRRSYEVAVVDDQDNPVAPGQVGEIVVRPRQPFSMFQEYYGLARESLDAFHNLWFHTGDSARIDAEGYFYFVDRKKDAIRRRGENISSFEVESVLNADPRVLECAAVAVPSEVGEDEVKLVLVLQPGASLTPEQTWALCEARMPRFWVPRFLEFRDSLPKTPNGKTQKFLLRQGLEGGVVHDRAQASGA